VKYAFINTQRLQHRVCTLCRVIEVSRAGFYAWRERKTQPAPDTLALYTAARAAHERGRHPYGPQQLRDELSASGYTLSLSALKRLRKRLGLRCKQVRKYKVTTDSNHHLPLAPNLLAQRFDQVDAPNQVWVSDITFVATDEGWLYLAAVKDLFTREIVGWAMDARMQACLVGRALFMAYRSKRPPPGLIAHSDQGSQYASGDYTRLLKQFGLVQSMSRRGNCWDNAPMESWFANLKKELVHLRRFATREQARAEIFEYWFRPPAPRSS
jgi:putative transposase